MNEEWKEKVAQALAHGTISLDSGLSSPRLTFVKVEQPYVVIACNSVELVDELETSTLHPRIVHDSGFGFVIRCDQFSLWLDGFRGMVPTVRESVNNEVIDYVCTLLRKKRE